ncbi:anthranilate phosphoribosyltransferase [Bacillus cabrialesii]
MTAFNRYIKKIINGKHLNREEAYQCMKHILEDGYNAVQTGALLTSLTIKGETKDELIGFVRAIRDKMIPFERTKEVLDTCGTGGDGSNSFNASTTASLISSSAGIPVAKNGNRSSTSKCGSADLLEALGLNIELPAIQSQQLLESTDFTFLFSQFFHPKLKKLASIRRNLTFRTCFNLIGPLCSPAMPESQLLGVPDPKLIPFFAELLLELGVERALIVSSMDGLDEISVSAPTAICEIDHKETKEYIIHPEHFNVYWRNAEEVRCDSLEDSVKAFYSVLDCQQSAINDFCIMNAGAALYLGRKADSIKQGTELARELLISGKVKEHFFHIKNESQRLTEGEQLHEHVRPNY